MFNVRIFRVYKLMTWKTVEMIDLWMESGSQNLDTENGLFLESELVS